MGFFAKMQSPVCPSNTLLSFDKTLQYFIYQALIMIQMGIKKYFASGNKSSKLKYYSITRKKTEAI